MFCARICDCTAKPRTNSIIRHGKQFVYPVIPFSWAILASCRFSSLSQVFCYFPRLVHFPFFCCVLSSICVRVVLIDSATLISSASQNKTKNTRIPTQIECHWRVLCESNRVAQHCHMEANSVMDGGGGGCTLEVENVCNNLLTDIMEKCQSFRYARNIELR